jgi:hypothetical protein
LVIYKKIFLSVLGIGNFEGARECWAEKKYPSSAERRIASGGSSRLQQVLSK